MVDKIAFFKSYYDAAKKLDDKEFKECLVTLFEYVFNGIEPDMDSLSPSAFMFITLVKPHIDASLAKASNGSKGGSNSKANGKQTVSKPQAKAKEPESTLEVTPKQYEYEDEEEKEDEYELPPISPPRGQTGAEGIDLDGIKGSFKDPEMGQAFTDWLSVRLSMPPFPYGAITGAISEARNAEKKYGARRCVPLAKKARSGAWKAIPWDDLEAKKPAERSGTKKPGFNDFQRHDYDFDAIEKAIGG